MGNVGSRSIPLAGVATASLGLPAVSTHSRTLCLAPPDPQPPKCCTIFIPSSQCYCFSYPGGTQSTVHALRALGKFAIETRIRK